MYFPSIVEALLHPLQFEPIDILLYPPVLIIFLHFAVEIALLSASLAFIAFLLWTSWATYLWIKRFLVANDPLARQEMEPVGHERNEHNED